MTTERPAKTDAKPVAAAKTGGDRIVSLGDIQAAQREERIIDVPEFGGSIRLRGLSTGQVDAINSTLGESSEFRMMTSIAVAAIIEPEGVTEEMLLELTPSVVMRIGAEVAGISGMDEKSVAEAEKSFRDRG